MRYGIIFLMLRYDYWLLCDFSLLHSCVLCFSMYKLHVNAVSHGCMLPCIPKVLCCLRYK